MAQTTTSSTNLPDYLKDPTKKALGSIEDFLGSGQNYVYGSKRGENLFTPLSSSQQKSIGNVNWLADQDLADMFGISDAEGYLKDFANDPAALVKGNYGGAQIGDMGRIVDEGGELGAISDYMDPYLEGVLDPQIREINEALQRGRNDLGSMQAMSGAFGDARHGILEGEMYRGGMEEVSDTTGQAYSDAFNNAMGLRSGDLARLLNIEMANQASTNQGTGRNLQRDLANQAARQSTTANKAAAAQGMAGLGDQYLGQWSDVNDMLFNAGEVEREVEMERNEAMREFTEALKNKKYDDAMKLLMAVQGVPYETETKSKTKSNDGLWGGIGSAIGSLFG